jgi:hypothetical protein
MTPNEQDTPDSQAPDSDAVDTVKTVVVDPEFTITVHKLDVATRPRGVLAE